MRRVLANALLTIGAIAVFAASAHAGTIDLTTAGSSGTANGAFYQQVPDQSTGTGVIEPFLRVHATGIEQGYNSEAQNPPEVAFDEVTGIWTHDLLFSDLVQVTLATGDYYQFLLDINQTKPGALLSLNQVQIYTRDTTIPLPASTDLTTLGSLKFDSDVGVDGDTTVNLNYSLNPGSGAGDMFLYVPIALFAGVEADDFVYFYTLFGNGNGANDGFEEWALVQGPGTSVPDGGSTMALLGLALVGLGAVRRKFLI